MKSRTEKGHDSVIGTAIYMSPEVMRGSDMDDSTEKHPGYGRSTVTLFVVMSTRSVLRDRKMSSQCLIV